MIISKKNYCLSFHFSLLTFLACFLQTVTIMCEQSSSSDHFFCKRCEDYDQLLMENILFQEILDKSCAIKSGLNGHAVDSGHEADGIIWRSSGLGINFERASRLNIDMPDARKKSVQQVLCIDRLLKQLNSKLDELLEASCSIISLVPSDIISGLIILDVPGNYCLSVDMTATVTITAPNVHLDLNGRQLTGRVIIDASDTQLFNGKVVARAPVDNVDALEAAIVITANGQAAHLSDLQIAAQDADISDVNGRSALYILAENTCLVNICSIKGGTGGDLGLGTSGGSGIVVSSTHEVSLYNCRVIKAGLTIPMASKIRTDFVGNASGYSVTTQADGKIVVAGFSNVGGSHNFTLVRYNTDGLLDISFGTGGKVITDFGGNDIGRSLAIQVDGKIVVAGTSNGEFAVARYNSDGSLDTSFGTGGKVTTSFTNGAEGTSVALQSDGKIVVAGLSGSLGFNFALARYNTDGSLDTSFGTGGKVTTPFTIYSSSNKRSVLIQPDGKIVVGSNSGSDFALARYNTDGSLDSSFGTGGKEVTDLGGSDFGKSVAMQLDGKILLGGGSDGNFALVRYNTNGSLDTSFGTGGKVVTDFGGNDDARSVAIQSDGKILLAGTSNYNFALARYNLDGSLDTSFGTGGKVVTDFGGNSTDDGQSVVVEPNGRIIIAGHSSFNFAIVRYKSDGSLLSSSYGGSGLKIKDSSIICVEQCSFYNAYNGVELLSTSSCHIISCKASGNANDGFSATSSEDNIFQSCSTIGNFGAGFYDSVVGNNSYLNNFACDNMSGNYAGIPADIVKSQVASHGADNVDCSLTSADPVESRLDYLELLVASLIDNLIG